MNTQTVKEIAIGSGRVTLRGLVFAFALAVAACQNELYSNLTEQEANQILVLLMSNGIGAEKIARGKEGFAVMVDGKDMLRAMALMKDAGYPRGAHESMGKVFRKSGIMSSPFEERVRYIYALGEEVAQTLNQIDGVVTARVHIVLPDQAQLGQPVKPSSAAVFIKHQAGVDLDFFVPQIRRLVSSSIEGLEYAAVTVVLADAQPTKVAGPEAASFTEVIPGLSVRQSDVVRFWQVAIATGALVVLLVLGLIGTALACLRLRRRRPSREPVGTGLADPT